MNLYIILAVAVASHCPGKNMPWSSPGFINVGNAVYTTSSPTPPNQPDCVASMDVKFSTEAAVAEKALEAGARVFKEECWYSNGTPCLETPPDFVPVMRVKELRRQVSYSTVEAEVGDSCSGEACKP